MVITIYIYIYIYIKIYIIISVVLFNYLHFINTNFFTTHMARNYAFWTWTDGRTARQTDRQTGLTKLIVALRNFANATKKSY